MINIEIFRAALQQQLPSELTITSANGELQLRDKNIENGRGYQVRINREPRYFQAIFEFEDYARPLIDHASAQIDAGKSFLSDLTDRYPAFSGKIFRRTTENILDTSSRKQDVWWLVFEYKVDEEEAGMLTFADILLFLIFFLFPYRTEGEEEGERKDTISTTVERSRFNRALCLAFHGYDCKACGQNMRQMYRGLKSDFVHVHHLNPVAAAGTIRPDPIRDMVPLCPNCHTVAHSKNPPYTVQEIKEMIQGNG
ncbi:HNH endonuclease [Mucilaginibacter sp.]|uniref:HNH endonuclease n=1 Tax=Mucilaginibacter sp. TaxID=1882438 RepID=UPI00262894BF|nr:HNH endonuclease [Mucilaginibacter sp.]MDB5129809.1 restriction endonuclease [Mucilaginibacter sp.]